MRATTRRTFLHSGLAAAGLTLAPHPVRAQEGEEPTNPGETATGSMELSLSARVAEKFDNKKETSMTILHLIDVATMNGFNALCMRASQAGIHTPEDTVQQMSAQIQNAGLRVSMITGDFNVPQNDEQAPDLLGNITPYLDLAGAFQCDLIRVAMKKEEDIAAARKAADEAKERDIRLAHQSHVATLFETVEGSLDVLKRVGRQNFGLIYEPANWMIADEPYGAETVKQLKDYIFNVYVQNHRLNPEGAAVVKTNKKGEVRLDHIGLWEKGGVRFEEVFRALHEVGYSGYVTVHQAFEGVMSVYKAADLSAEYLRPLIERGAKKSDEA